MGKLINEYILLLTYSQALKFRYQHSPYICGLYYSLLNI